MTRLRYRRATSRRAQGENALYFQTSCADSSRRIWKAGVRLLIAPLHPGGKPTHTPTGSSKNKKRVAGVTIAKINPRIWNREGLPRHLADIR